MAATSRPNAAEPESIRLDKWLWAARFFKTRQDACDAINGGRVHLNGNRTKPGKDVKVGNQLHISKGSVEWDIVVEGIAKQRRPASEAALLYTETEESKTRRAREAELRREMRLANPHADSKPNKRDRRLIHRFTQKTP